jgi:hypothetical protein
VADSQTPHRARAFDEDCGDPHIQLAGPPPAPQSLVRDIIARNAQLPWIAQISMNLVRRRRTRVPHRERRRRSLGVRLHVAMTARRAAEFRGTLRPERHCAVDFIPRREAIQPDALFFYVEVLHYALRTIQTIFGELSPPGRFCFGLSQLPFLFDLGLPGQDRSLIVPPSLLLVLSPRETCPLFHLLD